MRISQEDRWTAETLFVRDGMSLKQIAAKFKADRSTVRKWSRQGNWMERRRRQENRESPLATLEVLKSQRELLIKDLPADKAADLDAIDALHKLDQAIEKAESRLDTVGPMLEVFGRFARFVARRADDHALAVLREWTEKFLNDERERAN